VILKNIELIVQKSCKDEVYLRIYIYYILFLCRKIISQYDDNYGSCGLDEAFADLTNHLQIRATSSEQQRTFPKEVISSYLSLLRVFTLDNLLFPIGFK